MRLSDTYPGRKIAVLNFASATKPGGGVINGSSAQEESLCRCSTLYPTLDRRFLWQSYYDVNRAAGDVLHTDACIYSPGIVICKTDENFPERMPQEDWVTVDVISCAAPNLRNTPANLYNPETDRPSASCRQICSDSMSSAPEPFLLWLLTMAWISLCWAHLAAAHSATIPGWWRRHMQM